MPVGFRNPKSVPASSTDAEDASPGGCSTPLTIMLNSAALQMDRTSTSALPEGVASSLEMLDTLRLRLLDPALDAQGVLALSDAILALQRASRL